MRSGHETRQDAAPEPAARASMAVLSEGAPVLKICGMTREADARHAVRCGATAIGFVLWPRSPRYVAPEQVAAIVAALPATVTTVGVFVDASADHVRRVMTTTGLAVVQLHGDETPEDAAPLEWPILRATTVDGVVAAAHAWPRATLLLDAADPERRGGTGRTVDWTRAADVAHARRVILAGGLGPENVAEAIGIVQPAGVDVSSGVEASPGVKDPDKVARFLENARNAFERR